MEKQKIRKTVRVALKQKTLLECTSAGSQILYQLRNKLSSGPLHIACYISRFPEVDTNPIIEYLFSAGHVVHVPSWSKSGKMWMVPLSDINEYRELFAKDPNYYYHLYVHHIPMPPNPFAQCHIPIDICITPGLVFSTFKSTNTEGFARVGYGFGHYDWYFFEYVNEHGKLPFIIGISHDEQITTERLYVDSHDTPMNCLITPSCVYD